MKIFKFGGASVKDAESVKNVSKVLESQGFESCVLVVSAMGKTTNALEKVVHTYFNGGAFDLSLGTVVDFHIEIARGLFSTGHPIFAEIKNTFVLVESFLKENKSSNFNFVYDQVVSAGEIVSSKILSQYLNEIQFRNDWIDAREYIKTDQNFREGNVNWDQTVGRISKLDISKCYVTQGFIGGDDLGNTVTLGREGSDYSAAIFAYSLNADAMTIWKDVPGVMTGDPRKFKNVTLMDHISYEEAIEMAYYGASVIHPKTLQPLKQKNIPFYVKSFLEPTSKGTAVGNVDTNTLQQSFILKENQHLIRIATRDFSFIAEDHLSLIFSLLAQHKIKISLMQNSAISLDLCVEDLYNKIDIFADDLRNGFQTELIKNVSLYTIRNANLEDSKKLYQHRKVLLEQLSHRILQVVTN